MIWRSRWVTDTGIVESREALAFPGQADTGRVMLRRIHATDDAASRRYFNPAPGTTTPADRHARHRGPWTGRTGNPAPALVRRRPRPPRRGDRAALVLELTVTGRAASRPGPGNQRRPLPEQPPDPDTDLVRHRNRLAAAVPALEQLSHPAGHAAYLRGAPRPDRRTGGMVAAATTSLPERAEAGRNYDYRYVWIRDQCYAGQAVAAAGPHPLLDDAVRFITDRVLADGDQLAPAYTSTGDPVPDQRHPGPARLPRRHTTSSATGSTNNSNSTPSARPAAVRRRRPPRPDGHRSWRAAEALAAGDRRPLDGTRRRHLGNRQPALDPQPAHLRRRTAGHRPARRRPRRRRLADPRRQNRRRHRRHLTAPHRPLATLPQRPRARTPHCCSHRSAGRCPPTTPAPSPPWTAYLRDLTVDGYAYRFRHDQRPLDEAEGSFTFCGFLVALALHQQHQPVDATAWFERTRSACGSPGLYSEEYDTTERQLRGNLPQAFVHALHLETAARISAPHETDTGHHSHAR